MRYVSALLLLLILWFAGMDSAAAASCRTSGTHVICILNIQRSAKNFWEYRAVVKVDGITRPLEIYNCRDRLRIQKDGTPRSFEPDGPGNLICRMFQR